MKIASRVMGTYIFKKTPTNSESKALSLFVALAVS